MSNKLPRRGFLKVLTVATGALGYLFPEWGAKAQGASSKLPWANLKSTEGKEITGAELTSLRGQIESQKDVVYSISQFNRTNSTGQVDLGTTELQAVHHKVAHTDNFLLAAVWKIDSEHVLSYLALDKPVDNVKTQVHLFRLAADGKSMSLITRSANNAQSVSAKPHIANEDYCGQCDPNGNNCCSPGSCSVLAQTCTSVNLTCVAENCVPCLFSCGNPAACAICLLTWCPFISVEACCTTSYQPACLGFTLIGGPPCPTPGCF